jgi:hypothetical protein
MDPGTASETAIGLAIRHHGVVARWQLRGLGVADDRVRALARTGAWLAVTDEVLVRVGAPPGRGQSACAAVLDAGPGAVLSFQPGASWWRVPGAQLVPAQTVTTVHSRRRSTLSRVHVVRRLPIEWTTLLDGVPVARPELVALHLFATEPYGRAERWVERMWSLRLLDGRSLARFLVDLGSRGRNGTAGLRRYLDARPAPYTPSATGVELRARSILRSAGFSVRAQVDSGSTTAWTGRVDLRDDEQPVILEVQSAMYHEALVDAEADRARLTALRAAGHVVVEVTDADVFHRPEVVVRRYEGALEDARRSKPRSGVQNQQDRSGSAHQNGESREEGRPAAG